ncbi:MAG TPA: ATP-binding protein [Actinobacteria bacterium]|nr:ATP-binding protein [Actinomycetota bacterium]
MRVKQVARHLEAQVDEALNSFRVVVLHGARQCGKTTLARLVTGKRNGTYVTLDDDAVREAALADPRSFLTSQSPLLTIDEIQLGGDRVIRMIKQLVDEDPTPGRFLLTGSTNFLTVPTISESLAGRSRILRLWPFSEAELNRVPVALEEWFGEVPHEPSELERDDYLQLVCRGGYPEMVDLDTASRHAWIESYLETVTQRDIAALADIRKVSALPRLLRWVAGNTSGEINVTTAARDLGIDRATTMSYLQWLEAVFLVRQVPAWSRNLSARAVRRPKYQLTDTGLAADLLGASPQTLGMPTAVATGPLLESFVVNEIAKQLSSKATPMEQSHYRDNRHGEVDLILERRDGATIAIEVKASSSPVASQLKHVKWLRDKLDAVAPGTFHAGILLHTGSQSLTVGDRLHLLPISSLWIAPR